MQESSGRPGAIGPQTEYGQALGLTQMLPSTARGVARNMGVPYREDLLRGSSAEAVRYQRALGRAYFNEALQRTGNITDALHYYHGGPDRRLWGPRTRAYARSVLGRVRGR